MIDLALSGVFLDKGSGTNKTVSTHHDVVDDGAVNPEKTVLPDLAKSGDNHLGSQEAVIRNPAVMADVVAAPENHVVPHLHEGLQGIVLEDETVFADLHVMPDKCPAADIADTRISLLLDRQKQAAADSVQFCRTDGDKRSKFLWRIVLFQIFEGNDRQPVE